MLLGHPPPHPWASLLHSINMFCSLEYRLFAEALGEGTVSPVLIQGSWGNRGGEVGMQETLTAGHLLA